MKLINKLTYKAKEQKFSRTKVNGKKYKDIQEVTDAFGAFYTTVFGEIKSLKFSSSEKTSKTTYLSSKDLN